MPSFGTTSIKRLQECDDRIQIICYDAIQLVDFSIVTGHRTKEKQDSLYPKYTKVKWPNSKHNTMPSIAIDIAPYIKPYGVIFGNSDDIAEMKRLRGCTTAEANAFVIKAYARMIGTVEAMAYKRGIDIRVGMDWDGDYDMLDQKFHDLGHWELVL